MPDIKVKVGEGVMGTPLTPLVQSQNFCLSGHRMGAIRWIIDPPLEVTIPSKRSPWPDAPPELPIKEKVLIGTQEQVTKHPTKTRTSRSRHSRSKRKHDTKLIGVQVSTHAEQH